MTQDSIRCRNMKKQPEAKNLVLRVAFKIEKYLFVISLEFCTGSPITQGKQANLKYKER
jgi:hypothetical protein